MSIYCKIKKKVGKFNLNIDFQAENETVALMGASGCGKSMTLRCIAGIEKPDSGRIIINGQTVYDSEKGINLAPQKRRAGYLFQDFALIPNMTVKKNILVVMPKEKRGSIESVMERFHLTGLENHYPAQLSGGQKQRCAIARIIVSAPWIIMLDEPFSALDSYLKWQLEREIMSVINEFGKTVLFVSHDRDEVYRISDKVVVIENGRNEPICTKQVLYQHPQTYADALLTGCKNIFPVLYEELTIRVPDLALKLESPKEYEDVCFLGIRAKQILPEFMVEDKNSAVFVSYTVEQVTEAVFSMILMVRPENGHGLVRWEMPKEVYHKLSLYPPVLAIPKKEILYLKADRNIFPCG
ncbi:sulfate/molybdate ABC transporter ATP-binding protein [Anaerocolumna xylanovorans]|uniref:Molybdate transport system ATP-binding protein n=1 Tax=Anaerocolumna xylanovorans DSM 12503 TaxID=1121345 RepID=A0A1M7YHN2_9FIRM|nr:ATP-binding cassette domain-containing protein [Anaerocolumna xylanovorans]SHO52165.1 molybdate transport system ATP-binding protein [Anaerocolumna xylanovorans DSM 12503]